MIFISSACAMPLCVGERLSPKDRDLGERVARTLFSGRPLPRHIGSRVRLYALRSDQEIDLAVSRGENFAAGEIFVANALMIFYYPL
jgi:hypothetical protein